MPKFRLLGLDPSAPAATPMPEIEIVRLGLVAFEAMVTLPLATPPLVGVKVTFKVAL